jgi:hypothetical protein
MFGRVNNSRIAPDWLQIAMDIETNMWEKLDTAGHGLGSFFARRKSTGAGAER